MKKSCLRQLELIEKMVDGVLPHIDRIRPRRPFKILISCLLSTRTKDEVTEVASNRLFARYKTPLQLAGAPLSSIRRLIYPVGFYKVKAKHLKDASRTLIKDFKGKVPQTKKELLLIKGIGNKCANLVLSVAFSKEEICVDTHVHRISNRLGWVRSKKVSDTEEQLRKVLPPSVFSKINRLLVSFGKNICRPLKPLCGQCLLQKSCLFYNSGKRG